MAGDDPHLVAAHLAQLGGHLFRQSVAEVVALAIGAQIGEGQHGQPYVVGHGLGLLPRQTRDKPVPAARHGFNEARGLGVVAQRGAQPLHGRVEAVLEVHECPRGPQAFPNAVAGDDMPGLLEEQLEDLEGLILQADAAGSRLQLTCIGVQFEGSEADRRGHWQWYSRDGEANGPGATCHLDVTSMTYCGRRNRPTYTALPRMCPCIAA